MLENSQQLLRDADPEIFSAIEEELSRQRNGIELIASENFVSRAVLAVLKTGVRASRPARDDAGP